MNRFFVMIILVCLWGGSALPASAGMERIGHIIVIYQENWSFDGLYGKFPGADNLENAGRAARQVSLQGTPLPFLPRPYLEEKKKIFDDRFPERMKVAPFDLSQYVPVTAVTGDMVHRFYQEQVQINGGKMDMFVAASNNGGLVMSYFDAANLPEGILAQKYTLCDRYFHDGFGGSFLNHIFLVAAAPIFWAEAPDSMRIQVGEDGMPVKDGAVTPDGYVVNTIQSVNHPHDSGVRLEELLPGINMPTIGDRLSDKSISWAWFAGGYDDALAGNPDEHFEFHHQPFVYFKKYADGTSAKHRHLKDEKDLNEILDGNGRLPQVSFVKFLSLDDEHPKDSDVMRGQQHTAELVEKILRSPYGRDCAILITYDENGGRWDHVPPPKGDRWGPGTRVPLIVISPFAKKGFVDHTEYTTMSILKFIESRFGLRALTDRDAGAVNLDNAFDFN